MLSRVLMYLMFELLKMYFSYTVSLKLWVLSPKKSRPGSIFQEEAYIHPWFQSNAEISKGDCFGREEVLWILSVDGKGGYDVSLMNGGGGFGD